MQLRGMPLPFLITTKAVACGERLLRDYSKVKVMDKVWWQVYGNLLESAKVDCLPEEEGGRHRALRLLQQQQQPLQQPQQPQQQQHPLPHLQQPLQPVPLQVRAVPSRDSVMRGRGPHHDKTQ